MLINRRSVRRTIASSPLRKAELLAIERFRKGRRTGAGAQFGEFLIAPMIPDRVKRQLLSEPFYEFPWGFMTESHLGAEGIRWDFHVQWAWKLNLPMCWAKFDQAHSELAVWELHKLRDSRSQNAVTINTVDARPNYSAMSLNSSPPSDVATARAWIAERYLPVIWPLVRDLAFELFADVMAKTEGKAANNSAFGPMQSKQVFL